MGDSPGHQENQQFYLSTHSLCLCFDSFVESPRRNSSILLSASGARGSWVSRSSYPVEISIRIGYEERN